MRSKSTYPRAARDLRDYDYADRLSPEDRAYLEKFDREYYGASVGENPLHATDDLRKSVHRTNSQRIRDVYNRGARADSVSASEFMDNEGKDWSPGRHESVEYRAALAEFRSHLPADPRKNAPDTPEFKAATVKLDRIAGVKTNRRMEGAHALTMAKSRLERTKAEHRIVWHLGVTVAKCNYTGMEAEAAVEMLSYLESRLAKLDDKLKGMGFDSKQLPWVAQAQARNGSPNGGA